jgi:hypothetical protein
MRVHRRALAGKRVTRLTVLVALLSLTAVLLSHNSMGACANGLMFMLPALALTVVLLCGRYPGGARAIERLRRARARRPRERAVSVPRPRRRPVESRRGGRLIALSLAGRAPPLAAGCR